MIRMATSSVIILAVHHPGFLRMQFQMTLRKPLLQRRQQLLRLYLCLAVANGIICIALKRNVGELLPHPAIKHIVQKQVTQQGAETPPCGVPLSRANWLPSSNCTGAVNHRSTYNSNHLQSVW